MKDPWMIFLPMGPLFVGFFVLAAVSGLLAGEPLGGVMNFAVIFASGAASFVLCAFLAVALFHRRRR